MPQGEIGEADKTCIITTGVSDLLQNFSGRADLIVANLIADLVMALFADAKEYLAPDGRLLVSGIIDERLADVLAAAREYGFAVQEELHDSGWVALVLGAADSPLPPSGRGAE